MKKILFILLFICFSFPHYVNNNHLDYNTLNRQTPGDLNSDGIINVQDIILLVNLVLNSEYDSLGDLNFDGLFNILDVTLLVNHVLYQSNEYCSYVYGDFDANDELNVIDIIYLVNTILGN